MRKLFLASVAVLALSSAAQAANTATTVQVGLVNGSSVLQQGLINDSSSTTFQLGIVNSATTMQGTSSASLNNGSSVTQIGVQNSATTGQVASGNNGSAISQNSFGPARFRTTPLPSDSSACSASTAAPSRRRRTKPAPFGRTRQLRRVRAILESTASDRTISVRGCPPTFAEEMSCIKNISLPRSSRSAC